MDDKNFPYTSLCMVIGKNSKGFGMLKRLADTDNKTIKPISHQLDCKTLYKENCQFPVNFVGIFGWRQKTKGRNLYGKTGIASECHLDKVPIEVIILKKCFNKYNFVKQLQKGIDLNFSTGKVLIVYQVENYIYSGVLFKQDDFISSNNVKKIKSDNLSFVEVDEGDEGHFLYFDKKIFYRKLNLEPINTNEKYISADNSEIDKIQKEITDKKSELEEITAQLNQRKNLVVNVEKESIAYQRTLEMISDQINQRKNFSSELEKEITAHQETLEKLSTADSTLAELQEKIDADTLKLQETQQKLDEELKNCIDLEEEIKNLKLQRQNLDSKLEEINNQIKKRENFALEVENKIAQRIESARKNVADFICEMAFVNPNFGAFGAVQTSKNNFYCAGEIINGKDCEIKDIQDFIDTLKGEIGVETSQNENILPFAAYLTAAYTNRILLLLAGSNARDIADAFSVTLTGKTAAIFDCSNVHSLDDLEVVLNIDDEVISVLNPFAPNFTAYLPGLVNIRGKFIFAIYPFVEDLKIEPRSFYNYFLPVFTELIIDRPPTRDFPNRYFLSDELKQYFKNNYNPDEVPISAEERVKKLKKNMQKILDERKKSAELFADFPLAYVKGKEEKFIADFKGDEKILEKIRAFLGTDE